MRRFTLTLLLVTAVGCDPLPVDRFPSPKGNAPPVEGVLEGSVIYIGPAPECERSVPGGPPTAIQGRVVLTLFDYNNPPPPEGKASSALNLLVIPASDFFSLGDCMPPDPTPQQQATFITRAANFTWPELVMGRDYQVRGFFDRGGDFLPFFTVRRSVTAGDVVGGALLDPTGATPGFARISFGTVKEHPRGQVLKGAVVTLAAPVMTEPPMFEVDASVLPLASESTLPMDPNPVTFEAALFNQTQLRLILLDGMQSQVDDALDAAGISPSFGPLTQAWYVRGVDGNGDGAPDLHPVLGSAHVPWQTPILILRRAQTPAEVAAGIPTVSLIGSPRPTQTAFVQVFRPSIEMLVPPVALVDLLPTEPSCTVPYLAPFNPVTSYESGPAECQELPTGRYGLTVLHGVAAAAPVEDAVTSETGFNLSGGIFAGQSWSIPNELGPPDTEYNPLAVPQLEAGLLLSSQGPAARLILHDATVANGVRHDCAAAPDPLANGAPRPIALVPVPEVCCQAVAHLCDLPLCEPRDVGEGLMVRELRELGPDGEPACVPFLPPATCCGAG